MFPSVFLKVVHSFYRVTRSARWTRTWRVCFWATVECVLSDIDAFNYTTLDQIKDVMRILQINFSDVEFLKILLCPLVIH